MTDSSVVFLLSGGLDSSANLAIALSELNAPIENKRLHFLALTCDYGQRAARREIESARNISEYFGIAHEVIDLRWLGHLKNNALTDTDRVLPELKREQLDEQAITEKTAKAVWVPNRNGVLIQVAAAVAEARGFQHVVVGFNAEEAATFPDNTQAFLERSNAALSYSTRNGVAVRCYTTEQTKREIVARLRQLSTLSRPFPFELLWSCYQGNETPCGCCESCQRLKRALVS